MTLDDLHSAKYIALKTFRKNGQGVVTPVWQVPEGDRLYVWTGANSGKVKRIRNNQRVRLAKSNWRGKPMSEWVTARARILDDAAAETAQLQRLATKYRWQFRLLYRLLAIADHVVVEISST